MTVTEIITREREKARSARNYPPRPPSEQSMEQYWIQWTPEWLAEWRRRRRAT